MGCGPSCFCARPYCDYLKTKTTAFLSKLKEVGTEAPQTAAFCSVPASQHCFSTSPKRRRFGELSNSIGQCLRRFLGFRKNRIDMQNLRWRNLEAKTGFAGSFFMTRRFSETVALRFFPPRKSKAGRICSSVSDIFLKNACQIVVTRL